MTKRVLDVAIAGGVLLLSLPLFLVVALAVRLKLGHPVLFRQTRPGLHGQSFEMVKFRTMRNAFGANGDPLPDSERLTNFGRLLRHTSLDELPELWNVLKGEMSLVGPRPLLVRYLAYYTESEMARFLVRPGITGWAQVRGRNSSSWNERLADDVWYVEHQSLWLDLRILATTIGKVFTGSGVVVDTNSAMLDLDLERQASRDPTTAHSSR